LELRGKIAQMLHDLRVSFALDPLSVPPLGNGESQDGANTFSSGILLSPSSASPTTTTTRETPAIASLPPHAPASDSGSSNDSSVLSSDSGDGSNNNARKNSAIAAMQQNMNAGGNTDIPPRTTPATIKQLKEECKSHNLKVSGTKPQLLERLRVFKLGEKDDGGRGDDEPVTKWTGMTAKQLKEECKKHDIPVGGNKVALLEQLSQFKEMKSQIARETIPMRDLSEQDLVALQ
jgi:hypothetical protein